MNDIIKDKVLIFLLVLGCIIVFTVLLYGTITSSETTEQERLNKIFPGPLPILTLPSSILLTNEKNIILPDPSAEIFRIQEFNRPGCKLRFTKIEEINQELNIILNQNKYPYQIDPWNIIYFWRKQVSEPRFSVIVPVFNQEEIIQRTLKGIFDHTKDDFEIIILVDGSTDHTLNRILEFFHQRHSQEDDKQSENSAVMIIEIKQSVFETQCDNIGFKLSSAPNILEIQADMTMTQPGFNRILERPLLHFSDICGVSGRCTHNITDSIGFPNEIKNTRYTPWKNDNIFYLLSTVNRGPLLLDRKKLIEVGYLDDKRFSLENDDHEFFTRAWKNYGYRCGYIHINFTASLNDGSMRKPMHPNQRIILQTRRYRKDYKLCKLPEFIVPNFRILNQIVPNSKVFEDIFGKKISTTLVQFANTESIYYHNAILSHLVHLHYRLNFENIKLYTEHNVQDFVKKLPPDAHNARGYFYWAWKPYIIKQALKLAKPDEIIIYADSGLFFTNVEKVHEYYQQALKNGYVFFDLWHTIKPYCKNECLHLFHDKTKLNDIMTDASLIFLKNNEATNHIIDEWLKLCTTPYLLSDQKNGAKRLEFMEHRHDQTLLSIVLANNNIQTIGKQKIDFTCHHKIRTKNDFIYFWKKLGLNSDLFRNI